VYETLAGWGDESLAGCASVEELPEAARRYVEFVERELDVEVTLVGTGAERMSVLTRA
jgi:adenylosuccinate synthase